MSGFSLGRPHQLSLSRSQIGQRFNSLERNTELDTLWRSSGGNKRWVNGLQGVRIDPRRGEERRWILERQTADIRPIRVGRDAPIHAKAVPGGNLGSQQRTSKLVARQW